MSDWGKNEESEDAGNEPITGIISTGEAPLGHEESYPANDQSRVSFDLSEKYV